MAKRKANNLKLLLLASYINNLGWGIYSPLYAIYILKLGGNSLAITNLWAMYALLAGVLMMLFGRLENNKRYKPEYMLVIGYALFIVVSIGLILVKDVHQYIGVQLALAVAMGIVTPAAKLTYSRAEKRGSEAGQWGLFDGGNYILIAIASFSGGLLYKFGGFHAIFFMMLAIQIFSTGLAVQNLRLSLRSAR